jgi:hypothetical protein
MRLNLFMTTGEIQLLECRHEHAPHHLNLILSHGIVGCRSYAPVKSTDETPSCDSKSFIYPNDV